eukprot:TRINITY_DN906_c0_g2_i1.p1 TRINITY_DN906_c0_g2~~TRINITY_DN906_c0_g2_i1.p1  ORF type:complete len:296 (+),score=77.52 TRINITY_DN906_c0_g2_i1:416-1303(+)
MARCDEAAARIRANHSAAAVVPLQLDLASFQSVRRFAAALSKQVDKIDTLILNAGILLAPPGLSEDGIEIHFAVNHVGHQLLAGLLLPLVEKAAPSTVVVVAGNLCEWKLQSGNAIELSVEKINAAWRFDWPKTCLCHHALWTVSLGTIYSIDQFIALVQSKLANVLFAQELSERMQGKGVYVNSLFPGLADTDLYRQGLRVPSILGERINSWVNAPGRTVMNYMRGVMWHPDVAALTSLYAAVSPEIVEKNITGKYFHPIARETAPCEHAVNKPLQKRLWEFTESLIESPPKRA